MSKRGKARADVTALQRRIVQLEVENVLLKDKAAKLDTAYRLGYEAGVQAAQQRFNQQILDAVKRAARV